MATKREANTLVAIALLPEGAPALGVLTFGLAALTARQTAPSSIRS